MRSLANILLLIAGLTLLPSPDSLAASVLKFNPKTSATMRESLVELKNERVTLTLESGDQIEGKITMVGDSIVYIAQLAGNISYDAVVSIEKINAITFRKEY